MCDNGRTKSRLNTKGSPSLVFGPKDRSAVRKSQIMRRDLSIFERQPRSKDPQTRLVGNPAAPTEQEQRCNAAYLTMESQYADADPFADPTLIEDQRTFVGESTLIVGRNASLTLGTDSLIVLGISPRQEQPESAR